MAMSNRKFRGFGIIAPFRELGRVARTIFLLNYIDDVELRKIVQAAPCKSEEFNNFIAWIVFGGGGIIADNMRHNQRNPSSGFCSNKTTKMP